MNNHGLGIQAERKFSQIQQSPAKPGQVKSKKKAWIALDWLRRIERFQWLALTPRPKIFFQASLPIAGGDRRSFLDYPSRHNARLVFRPRLRPCPI
jgi:hypothetical protein